LMALFTIRTIVRAMKRDAYTDIGNGVAPRQHREN
jgi:hypothetical protein